MKSMIHVDTKKVDRYELICLVASTLSKHGQQNNQEQFMAGIYLDADVAEILQLATKYVDIVYKGE